MSAKFLLVKNKIKKFKKIIKVDGDKSISIRWLLLASQAIGVSRAKNLLKSEDVLNTIKNIPIKNSHDIYLKGISLPSYPDLNESKIKYISNQVNLFLN